MHARLDRDEQGALTAESRTAFLFDLDGTLVDSVYQHVLAWQQALEAVGIELAVWRIHRRIGMSGGLFINALLRETEGGVTEEQVARIQSLHAQAYTILAPRVRLLPGAHHRRPLLPPGGSAEKAASSHPAGAFSTGWPLTGTTAGNFPLNSVGCRCHIRQEDPGYRNHFLRRVGLAPPAPDYSRGRRDREALCTN
ncbi:MAG: HAD family hydrolase [Thermomicrobiales bacterium]